MNKLLKVTLITAIMATSGMCSERCQHMTFNANITYSQSYTISHDSTWITRVADGDTAVITGETAVIKGDVKITDGSRWIHNKGWIRLEGQDNIIDNSELVINDGVIAAVNTGKLNIKDRSSICLRDEAGIVAYGEGGILNIEDNSTIYLMDEAYIGAISNGTININEGSIFDARDSKDLSRCNTLSGTFNMKAGSIMYLPSTDIGDDKKANSGLNQFTITLPNEGDKPVELRYIQHTDITFDGLCPRVTPSGCKYKLFDWKKDTDNDDISYIQEPNTGIGFTWKGIDENTNAIPPSIAKLVPIYTWSVSTKCDGRKIPLLESRDLQCCDDIFQ